MKNEPHSFWMKNCVVHLDIIYIEDHKIVKIHHNCKPCFENDCDHFEGNGDAIYALTLGKGVNSTHLTCTPSVTTRTNN